MARFINKEFDRPELQEFLHNLPEAFAHGGKCIYKGRNTLKSFRIGNNEFGVKEFKPLSRLRICADFPVLTVPIATGSKYLTEALLPRVPLPLSTYTVALCCIVLISSQSRSTRPI